jgi:hypothetical protein
VQLLLRRCLAGGAIVDGRTFCLGAVQELTYDVQVAAVDEFERLLAMSLHECQFRLVILVANEDTHLCNAITRLYRVPSDRFMSDNRMTAEQRSQYMQHVFGQSESDSGVLRVCGRPGDGKSFYIEQVLQKRSRQKRSRQRHNIVLTELITKDSLVKQLVALDLQVRQQPVQGMGITAFDHMQPCAVLSKGAEPARADGDEQLQRALRASVAHAAPAEDMQLQQALQLSKSIALQRPDPRVVQQLMEASGNMGGAWSLNGCKRAAIAMSNEFQDAVQWALDHAEDADFDANLPDEAGPVKKKAAVKPDPTIVSQLMEMGYSENGCKRAAVACENGDLGTCMNWVLSHESDADFNKPFAEEAKSRFKATELPEAVADRVATWESCRHICTLFRTLN